MEGGWHNTTQGMSLADTEFTSMVIVYLESTFITNSIDEVQVS